MIIRPYSDTSLYSSGGPLEPTSTNFPACKHFFKCNEATAGAGTVTDSIGSVVLTSSGVTNNADGTITLDSGLTAIASGTLSAPGTKNVLLMWSGMPASTNAIMAIGSTAASTNRGFRSSANGSGTTTPAAVGDGATAVPVGTAGLSGTGAQLQARALTINWTSATGLEPYDWDGTTWTARAAAGDFETVNGQITGITTMDAAVNIGASIRPAYIQIWYFTTLPTAGEIKSALLWTHAMATTTPFGKYLYPGFKNRT